MTRRSLGVVILAAVFTAGAFGTYMVLTRPACTITIVWKGHTTVGHCQDVLHGGAGVVKATP